MVEWYGFAKDLTRKITEWSDCLTHADPWKFNAIRIAFYEPSFSYAQADQVMALIQAHGATPILDNHIVASYFPSGSVKFGSAAYRANWQAKTNYYKGKNVIFELANEPTSSVCDASLSAGQTLQQGIIGEYTILTNLIHAIDPTRVVVWIYWWGTSVGGSFVDPTPYYSQLTHPDKVVVTYHPYDYGDTQASQIPAAVNARIADVKARTKGLWPIWMGELEGTSADKWSTTAIRQQYTVAMFNAAILNKHGFNYWHYYNPASYRDDGGLDADTVITQAGYSPGPPPGQVTLTIQESGQGTTNPIAGSWSYTQGSTAVITATPASGWVFTNWVIDGNVAGTSNSVSLLMNSNHTVQAVFTQVVPTLEPLDIHSILQIPWVVNGTVYQGDHLIQFNQGAQAIITAPQKVTA